MRPHTLVLGYGWRDGVPFLKLRSNEGRGRVDERPLRGDLRLGIGPRRCTGWLQGKQRMPCPEAATPLRRQCLACEQRDGFRPCMICDGFKCPRLQPAIQRSCRQTHHMYLASFGGNEVKVGTASNPRRVARLVDQGPLAAARIAKAPGPTIKQMEHIVATQTSIVEAMRRSRKLELLKSPMSTEEAKKNVVAAWLEACAELPQAYHRWLHPPQWVEAPPLARETRKALAAETELPVEEGCLIEGQVVGAVGHVAVLEEEAGRFLLDLGELTARLVDPAPPDTTRRAPVQLGLL